MKKQIFTLVASAVFSWSAWAQAEGAQASPPDTPRAYGNSGWTPDMAYGDPAHGERGRAAARIAAEQRERARLHEERLQRDRERMAFERERELDRLHRSERERERARAQEREHRLARERELERERRYARERHREREIARERGWDRGAHPGIGHGRSRDRDNDGVANRHDRAPNDPRYY